MTSLALHQYYSPSGEILEYSLETLVEQKLIEINLWRDSELEKPVEYLGKKYDADQSSQFRVLAVVILGSGSPTGFWTSADNIDVPADASFMQGLFTAMLTKVATIHGKQRSMKYDIASLTSAADVAAYGVPHD